MKEALIQALNRIRGDQSLWGELAWKKAESGEDYFDENALKRAKILFALQWDLQPNDEDLLRFLFSEEIKDRNADPFQGGSEALSTGGYLLASFKNPANVWLLAQAKSANFDTHCGFDYQHLLSAGVQATFAYVQEQENPLKEYFHDFFPDLATCSLSEKDIAQWHQHKQALYLTTPPDSDIEYWLEVALEIEDMATVQELVVKLEAQSDESVGSLSTLKFYKEQLGDYAGAIALAEKIFAQKENPTFGDHTKFIGLYLNNNDPASAWKMIQSILKKLSPLSDYNQKRIQGLAIDIVLASSGQEPFALEAYRLGMNNIDKKLALVDLEKHLKATQIMEDKASESIVKKLYEAEASRIDAMMQRLKEK
ncbi:hypothetical protein BKI52_25005 [marine bacterium AO1-C]|nr:hypothetical protein BKI52_25005 [marine bacterium AO1-C]